MTEQQLRQKAVDMARSYLGAKEADGSHKPIIDLYNQISPLPRGYRMSYSDPWCAAFVSVVAANCGFLSIMPAECACDPMIALYKARGRWMEDDSFLPQIGDVIFYDWQDGGNGDDTGSSDHVGVIVDVYSSSFNVVEGNYSDSVKQRTMSRNARYIRGFGRPDYASLASEEPPTVADNATVGDDVIVQEPEADTFTLTFHVLRYGSGMGELSGQREEVRAVQRELKALGFDVGRWGLDGEFGYDTQNAVRSYQRSVRMPVTGKVDRATRAALLGVSA